MTMPEFSQRELENIEPIYQRVLNEKTFRQQNAIVVGSLRNECDKKGIPLIEFLRFKFLQEIESVKTDFEQEIDGKRCLFCDTLLTGKQQKFCSENHKVQHYNLQNGKRN
jgi:hypothetical protein